MPYFLRLLLSFLHWPKSSAARGRFVSLLEIMFCKGHSSKFNGVFHYFLYLIKELPLHNRLLHSAEYRSSGCLHVNTADSDVKTK